MSARGSVHPRARGEHFRRRRPKCRSYGSSPRTRRTRVVASVSRSRGRFIPAHAENTTNREIPGLAATVHPRARGEHPRMTARHCNCGGSSPRTRRTRRPQNRHHVRSRFIPAHAENTSRRTSGVRRSAVHPRARGEHTNDYGQSWQSSGSSPRTRRTRFLVVFGAWFNRFIPAHAENTDNQERSV